MSTKNLDLGELRTFVGMFFKNTVHKLLFSRVKYYLV